jgi:chromosome segregation protein
MSDARDRGAHFFRCDFQVHTPRDAQWHGNEAVTPADRKSYSDELVQACRTKGIDAIAITDHHDFAFFPHIKAAAEHEVDAVGNPIPNEKQLVVFPGLELTLSSPPCQALLLLDADFDEGKLNDIITILGLEITDEGQSKLPSVDSVSPTSVTGFNDLEEKLGLQKWLKGRFIILPNVTDGGYKTIFRDGFDKHYKEMRCVGGYVDGEYSKTSKGKKNILEGRQQNNGYQGLGVFQTSDNRRRDHSHLGKPITWVKWSEPTAEALRQACLARESRLSHEEPQLPSLWISSMSVSNSKFLSRLDIDFSQQYNAVIGGRGTGKSTILEYLRWGLCDQPVESADSDLAPVQTKRKKLIDDTLQRFDGEVIVTFFLNGIRHIVRRSSKTQEILLKIGNGEFLQTTENEVRNLLAVQAYSQKQLSSVGVRIEELKRFVELPIKHSLDQIRSDIRDTEAKLRTAYGNLIRKKEIEAEIGKYNIEIESLALQVAALRASLKGLSEDDQEIINQKAFYDNEELIVDGLANELARTREHIESLKHDIGEKANDQQAQVAVRNTDLIASIMSLYAEKFAAVRAQLKALSDLFEPDSLVAIASEVTKWQQLKTAHDQKYEAAKTRASANQQQLTQIREIEKRIAELKRLQMAKKNALSALGETDAAYAALRKRWDDLHNQKLQQLREQCAGFSGLSGNIIQADINGGLDTEALKRKFKVAFAGLNIKEQKIDDVCQWIASAEDPVVAWNAILGELEKLILHKLHGADMQAALPETPLIDRCRIVASEKTRIVAGCESAKWLDLSLAELEFNPVFKYCTNMDTNEYIDFADASAGQQATALLTVLLNQRGAPLIIDQPEDDVDSKLSPDIVRQIWKAKTWRQLIFASHNANFVVNGDAELVICCDYVRAGDQTGGQIKYTGAIDNKVIKDEITTVTEGGKAAFKLRKEKYGF